MSRVLVSGETELRTVRQHWYVFLPSLAVSLLILIVIGLLIGVSPGDVAGRSLRVTKEAAGLAAALFVAAVLTLRYLRWRYTTYTLTDRRVLVSRGVLSRFTESIALDRVQDVRVRQGLLARVFKAGSVEIESAGRDGHEVLRHVRDPVGFSDALQLQAQGLRTGQPGMTAWSPAVAPPPTSFSGYTPPGGAAGYVPPPPGYNPPNTG
jgi:uncharacterized membrane protein YdbT with pleckstrin-like domain